jgi:hypothetical protein
MAARSGRVCGPWPPRRLRERTWHQPARSRPGRSQAASGPTCGPLWCLGRAATGRALLPAGSSRAPCPRVRPGRRRWCGGCGHRRWPAALVPRRRSCRRDAGAPARAAARESPCSWLAQRTRRGRSHTRPPPEQRSERGRAKPQRRSSPEQCGHLSSEPPRSACAWSSTKITAGSFWHRPILPTGPSAGKGPVVLHPGASDQRNASHRTTGLKSARTPRNCAHHAVDAMDSSRPRIETSQPSSPTVTPGGIHVVVQSVALQGAVDLHPSCTPRYAPGQGMHLVKVCTWSRLQSVKKSHRLCRSFKDGPSMSARRSPDEPGAPGF